MIELSMEVEGAPEGLGALLNRVCAACCEAEGIKEAFACARLVDDGEIQRINLAFRQVDRPTDVLSFPSIQYRPGRTARACPKRLSRERDPDSGLAHLGDYVISLPTAQRQAREYGHSLARELSYLSAHALFHLMGYDHEREGDKRAMRQMEERALASIGMGRDKI